MVEANPQSLPYDANVQYGEFRTDKAPAPGYSAELISKLVEAKYYDDLQGQFANLEHNTLLKLYRRNVAALATQPFLGTRQELPEKTADGKAQFGDYIW